MRSDVVREWPPRGLSWQDAVRAWNQVESAMDGSGPPLCAEPHLLPDCEVAEGTVLLVGTSGSTGRSKFAQLTATALRASIDGVHAHLGGPGQWLLSVPPAHITGFQVLLRSHTAGYEPVCLPPGPFTPAAFTRAADLLDDASARTYTTLVPTQLVRILDDPAALDAARRFDRLLIGGAPLSAAVQARARAAGLGLTLGYGTSETSGGCVYDGIPLPCAQLRLDDGRVEIGGPMIATGYAGRPELDDAFRSTAGRRWFRTDDLGELRDGRLVLLGRADDVVNTGGMKVVPRVVEEAIATRFPEIADVAVQGLPDLEWGEIVGALLVARPGATAPGLEALRAGLDLPGYALPRFVAVADTIPLTGPGKPDREAVRGLLTTRRAAEPTPVPARRTPAVRAVPRRPGFDPAGGDRSRAGGPRGCA